MTLCTSPVFHSVSHMVVTNSRVVKQIYDAEGSDENSVPIRFDKKTKRIAANESAEIIRMLNAQAGGLDSILSDATRPRNALRRQ